MRQDENPVAGTDGLPQEADQTSPTGGEAPAVAADPAAVAAPPDGSALADVVNADKLQEMVLGLWAWVQSDVLTLNMGIQLVMIVGAFVPAWILGPRLKRLIDRQLRHRVPPGILRRACDAFATVATLIALWLTLTIFMGVLGGMGQSRAVISAVQSLLLAAIFIRLVTLVIRSPFWSKVAFYVAWPIAALDAFGILDNVVTQLNAAAIPIGESASGTAISLSALDVVRAGIIFAIFFWIASLASGILNRQIQNVDELNPSLKAMFSKILNFLMPILALVLALNMIGFNLSSLAIFSGAVGLGVGLGLQKVVSNFIAGFTLLADKSIKPGDVIEVEGVFGWVTDMKSRYVAVRTRDGHEHLVPNAIFIDDGVVNWSHNDRVVRCHAPFGVDYSTTNLRFVQEIAVKAAADVERVVSTPAPVCNLMAFGESSIDFDLRFWIVDPENGMSNVRSDVLLNIWEALLAHDIDIPFRQLDVHLKSSDLSLPDLGRAAE